MKIILPTTWKSLCVTLQHKIGLMLVCDYIERNYGEKNNGQ